MERNKGINSLGLILVYSLYIISIYNCLALTKASEMRYLVLYNLCLVQIYHPSIINFASLHSYILKVYVFLKQMKQGLFSYIAKQ